MVSKCYYVLICLICLSVAGCSAPNHLEFDEAFELSSFLRTHIRELSGQQVAFQIITERGEAASFGLLRFQWVEGGQMSFQTDPKGILHMEFEEDILAYEVMVSAELRGAKVCVTW